MSRTALSRVGTLLAVAIVAFTTFAMTLHAAQTITTPNETFFTYNLAAGGKLGRNHPDRERASPGSGRSDDLGLSRSGTR